MLLCVKPSCHSVLTCQLRKEVNLGNSNLEFILYFYFLLWMYAYMELHIEPLWCPVALYQIRMEMVLKNSALFCVFIINFMLR